MCGHLLLLCSVLFYSVVPLLVGWDRMDHPVCSALLRSTPLCSARQKKKKMNEKMKEEEEAEEEEE